MKIVNPLYESLGKMPEVLASITAERYRQTEKCASERAKGNNWKTCADPLMSDEEKLAVLVEEVGEVARELCDARAARRPPSDNLRVELVQVAAISVAWIEALEVSS